jgi:hypothetical protein
VLKKDQNQLFEEALHLQNCEMAMGEYYQWMSEKFVDEKANWEQATRDKISHAMRIGRLIAMISTKPAKFSPGKYRIAIMETFLNGIFEQIELLQDNKLSRQQILKFALDYESSLLMTKPYDVVDSFDPEFKEFRSNFAALASAHCEGIKQYIRLKLGMPNSMSHTDISKQ